MDPSRRTIKGRRGTYELLTLLTRGDLADVHLAFDRQAEGTSPWVVVHESRPEVARDRALAERFVAELRVLTRFDHPNLTRILDTGRLQQSTFAISEYMLGEGLGRLIQAATEAGQPLAPALAAGLLVQVCAGLEAAHTATDNQGQPVAPLHGNVHPACVVVGYDGLVRVVGFGAGADALSESTPLREVAYLAPERCRGQQGDARADVFSVGVLLWELLARRPLFRRVTQKGTLQAILDWPLPAIGQPAAAATPGLEQIAKRSLQRDPSQRFQSAGQMRDALAGWLQSAGARAGPAELGGLMQAVLAEKLQRKRELLTLARSAPVPETDVHLLLPDTDLTTAWASESQSDARPRAKPDKDKPASLPPRPATPASQPPPSQPPAAAPAPGGQPDSTPPAADAQPGSAPPSPQTAAQPDSAPPADAQAQSGSAPPAARPAGSPAPVQGTLEPEPATGGGSHRWGIWLSLLLGLGLLAFVGLWGWPLLFPEQQPAPDDTVTSADTQADGGTAAALPASGDAAAEPAPDTPVEPEPEPRPPPGQAWVSIQTDPAGCAVRLDGQKLTGRTPLHKLEVEADRAHVFAVFCRGHRFQKGRVTPRAGERLTLAFHPEPK